MQCKHYCNVSWSERLSVLKACPQCQWRWCEADKFHLKLPVQLMHGHAWTCQFWAHIHILPVNLLSTAHVLSFPLEKTYSIKREHLSVVTLISCCTVFVWYLLGHSFVKGKKKSIFSRTVLIVFLLSYIYEKGFFFWQEIWINKQLYLHLYYFYCWL